MQLQWQSAQTQQPHFSSRTTPVLQLKQPALTMLQPPLGLLLQILCKPQQKASAAAQLPLQPRPPVIQREQSLPARQRPPEKPASPPCPAVSCRGKPWRQVQDRGGCGASLPSSAERRSGLNLRSHLTGIALWTESEAGQVRWLRLLYEMSICLVGRDTGGQAVKMTTWVPCTQHAPRPALAGITFASLLCCQAHHSGSPAQAHSYHLCGGGRLAACLDAQPSDQLLCCRLSGESGVVWAFCLSATGPSPRATPQAYLTCCQHPCILGLLSLCRWSKPQGKTSSLSGLLPISPWPCRSQHGRQLHWTSSCSRNEQRALVVHPWQGACLSPAVALLEDA